MGKSFFMRMIAILVIFLFVLPTTLVAQVTNITPDATVGTTVSNVDNITSISGGMIKGVNQLHSFNQFTVGDGDVANFTGPAGTENILSRVTGGIPSGIHGTIQSSIEGANLFLMNPAGVLFGPKASLKLTGSFHVTTADAMGFANDLMFYADTGQDGADNSILMSARPEAFGFLGNPTHVDFVQNAPAAITINQATLQVSAGKILSVTAGDIDVRGSGESSNNGPAQLRAESGLVSLASMQAQGDVSVATSVETAYLLTVGSEEQGSISISKVGTISVSGDPGGTIAIRSGRLVLTNGFLFADTVGESDGSQGGIDVQVTDEILLSQDSFVTTDVLGRGDGGSISLTADTIELAGATSGSRAFEGSSGDPGAVTINAKSVVMTDASRLNSAAFAGSAGNSGQVTINANNVELAEASRIDSSVFEGTLGNGGTVVIEGEDVRITDGSQISSGSFGTGNGGDITITVDNAVTLVGTGVDSSGPFPSAISSSVVGPGNAGNATVHAKNVTLRDGAQMSSAAIGLGKGGILSVEASEAIQLVGSSFDDSSPTSLLAIGQGEADAGTVEVEAATVALSEGAQIGSGVFGSGLGGGLTVIASESLLLDGVSRQNLRPTAIFARVQGNGNAGQINVTSPMVTITGGAQISNTTFGMGNGGPITINASDSINLSGTSQGQFFISGLFANSSGRGVTGNGGNIDVMTKTLSLRENAQIGSNTLGAGHGGAIGIEAETVTIANGAFVAAASLANGDAGNITVDGETITISGKADATNPLRGDFTGLSTRTIDGVGGNISINMDEVMLSDNAAISAQSTGFGNAGTIAVKGGRVTAQDALITTQSSSVRGDAGAAGDIDINAEEAIELNHTSVSTTIAGGSQSGGDIGLKASQLVVFQYGTTVSATNTSGNVDGGRAGNIMIGGTDQSPRVVKTRLINGVNVQKEISLTHTIRLLGNSALTTNSNSTQGGNIDLGAKFLIQMIDSRVTSAISNGIVGGTIDFDPQFIVLQGDSEISTAASGNTGDGGQIFLGEAGDSLFIEPTVALNVSSRSGQSGTLQIDAAIQQLSESVAPLPESFLSGVTLYAARCAAQKDGKFSSFTSGGQDGLPPGPQDFRVSPILRSSQFQFKKVGAKSHLRGEKIPKLSVLPRLSVKVSPVTGCMASSKSGTQVLSP